MAFETPILVDFRRGSDAASCWAETEWNVVSDDNDVDPFFAFEHVMLSNGALVELRQPLIADQITDYGVMLTSYSSRRLQPGANDLVWRVSLRYNDSRGAEGVTPGPIGVCRPNSVDPNP